MPKAEVVKTKSSTKSKEKEVPLKYVVSDDLRMAFSDGSTIQHTESEFIISFFQTMPPILLTDADRNNLKGVSSYCVSRIVITPQQMKKNLGIWNASLEAWTKQNGEI